MRSNYKPLGKYIQAVTGRNEKLEDLPLMGLSITKQFIPSIANTIGTNMSTYRVIARNQFAYGPVTSRNGDKITIALFDDYDKALISQAYIPFEIKNPNELDPEYLMMWFRRPEFDRYARFKSHGSAREIFDWEEMCNVMLPVPPIEQQREIVAEYNTIQNRIKLNEQLIEKLEETAQAIYREWFVEFEFPDENGKPYKSNGGEMVWNEELGIEIPKGWSYVNLGNISTIKAGGDRPQEFSAFKTLKHEIPIYSNSSENDGLYGFTDKAVIQKDSITISARGAIIGFTVLRTTPFVPIVRLIVVTPGNDNQLYYLYETIRNFYYEGSGSAQGQLTIPDISSYKIMSPDTQVLDKFEKIGRTLSRHKEITKKETKDLTELRELLLSKLATVEN